MNPNNPITKPSPTKPLRHFIAYYSNSNIKFCECNLNENDQLHGLYERWYQNGQIWIRCTFKNGLHHDLFKRWNPDDQLCVKCTYQNDLLHGLYEEWNDDGSLHFRQYYVNGKIE
jgi:antitoxin component YwqK of YwqJK toxin-antitoxin module